MATPEPHEAERLSDIKTAFSGGDLDVPALEFVKTKTAAFSAEVAVDGEDLVFHFFLPDHLKDFPVVGNLAAYWDDRFAAALNEVAQAHFKVGYPRLRAQHINDLGVNSWWLHAAGFAGAEDLGELVAGLYRSLEDKLNSKST